MAMSADSQPIKRENMDFFCFPFDETVAPQSAGFPVSPQTRPEGLSNFSMPMHSAFANAASCPARHFAQAPSTNSVRPMFAAEFRVLRHGDQALETNADRAAPSSRSSSR
jgi:hypothetical protein